MGCAAFSSVLQANMHTLVSVHTAHVHMGCVYTRQVCTLLIVHMGCVYAIARQVCTLFIVHMG